MASDLQGAEVHSLRVQIGNDVLSCIGHDQLAILPLNQELTNSFHLSSSLLTSSQSRYLLSYTAGL